MTPSSARPRSARLLAVAVAGACGGWPAIGAAAEPIEPPAASGSSDGAKDAKDAPVDPKLLARLRRAPRGYARAYGALAIGKGIRFNNPYRLETQLGDDAESLSLTASYFDLSLGLSFGEPDGLQHGGVIHYSAALHGVGQQVITPSYAALYRGSNPFMLFGRAGLPVILTPDVNVGGELALGGAYFLTASLGVTAELIGDLFYGAATPEREFSTIPVLSTQIGIIVDYELLP